MSSSGLFCSISGIKQFLERHILFKIAFSNIAKRWFHSFLHHVKKGTNLFPLLTISSAFFRQVHLTNPSQFLQFLLGQALLTNASIETNVSINYIICKCNKSQYVKLLRIADTHTESVCVAALTLCPTGRVLPPPD